MHLPPFGWIKVLAQSLGWLRRIMFHPTLVAAHSAYLRRTCAFDDWEDIGEGVEVAVRLARWPGGAEKSALLIRSRTKYDAATVVAEAAYGTFYDDDSVIYNDTRVVSGLSNSPRVVTLTGIPEFRTLITDDGKWARTYSSFRVRVTSLTEKGVARTVDLTTLDASPLDQFVAQPYLWKVVGTDLFHIGEIVWAKKELQARLCYRYGFLGWLISRKPFISVLFWTPFVLRIRKFKPKVLQEKPRSQRARRLRSHWLEDTALNTD